jgi:CxxC motif-containing protein (DUF1111 family)
MKSLAPRPSTLVLGFAALLFGACHDSSSGGTTVVPFRPPAGGPVEGLTADELAAFERGREVFVRRFRPSEGLGPLYNATSCESCHSSPTVGGSAQLYRNFYLAMVQDGAMQVPLPERPSAVVPAFGAVPFFTLEEGRTPIPATVGFNPVVVAQRNALPLFGTGLFEFVTDATILSHSDPEDLDGDGISGRTNHDTGAVGRFGVKAQSNNVEVFTRAPLRNQMGVTSNPFLGAGAVVSLGHALPRQVSTDPTSPTTDDDPVPDPEIEHEDLGDLIAFARFLAPPERVTPLSASAVRGEARFGELGCAKCHLPDLETSRFGTIHAYSDLLLHEMGPELADGLSFGVPEFSSLSLADATQEFRTQPLWGVSLSGPFLHDGRAETLREAIEQHGGEGSASRDAFLALDATGQEDVIAFLEHL